MSKLGSKHSEETRKKMSESARRVSHKPSQGFQRGHGVISCNPTSKGKTWKLSDETRDKMSKAKIGNKSCFGKQNSLGYKFTDEQKEKHLNSIHRGEIHYKWISDRSQLKAKQERNDPAYKEWRKNVCDRDGWKCKISDSSCSGKLEVHHILGFTEHPELMYEINNGITLCHFHHPRKKSLEKELSPFFQDLIKQSSYSLE